MRGSWDAGRSDVKPNHLGTPLSLGETERLWSDSSAIRPHGVVTQMVTNRSEDSGKRRGKQGFGSTYPEPNKIGASTAFDFNGKNLTPYGGLLPLATMLEKLGFQALTEETVKITRLTRVMSGYQFVLAMVLGLYIGFSRLNQLRFIAR